MAHLQQRAGHALHVGRGVVLGLASLLTLGTTAVGEEAGWQKRLAQDLPLLGHRNWIVIADSAYPLQSGPGIETIATGEDQGKVVQAVLSALGKSRHVRPVIFLDAELPFVPERDAPGITSYREELKTLLKGHPTTSLPHEDVIARLDQSGKLFRVLILKTNLALPYTSVFIQLDCGYWSPEAEKRLREAMGSAKK
jgi:hypothetical protein